LFGYRIENDFYSQVDVLHHLELAAHLVDFGDGAGLDLVHESAQDLSVLKHILVGLAAVEELFAEDGLDPIHGLLLLLGIALAGQLQPNAIFVSQI
jgi:hypothetical protein